MTTKQNYLTERTLYFTGIKDGSELSNTQEANPGKR
jgi:hypothetical protein